MIDFRQATALFGGSFDPVHEGHLHVAREIQKTLPQIKKIIFVPAYQSPGKHPLFASPELRLRWLNIALPPGHFGVWDLEIQRKGNSYTIDTLEQAYKTGAIREKLYLIIGSDAYKSFESWKKPDEIRKRCQLIVVNRNKELSTAKNRQDLLLSIPAHPASSSEIRSHLASGSPTPWLPELVYKDIEKILPPLNPYVRKI